MLVLASVNSWTLFVLPDICGGVWEVLLCEVGAYTIDFDKGADWIRCVARNQRSFLEELIGILASGVLQRFSIEPNAGILLWRTKCKALFKTESTLWNESELLPWDKSRTHWVKCGVEVFILGRQGENIAFSSFLCVIPLPFHWVKSTNSIRRSCRVLEL